MSPQSSAKVIVSHPTGNANVSAVVSALHEAELLEAFYTCILWRPESTLAKLVPGSVRAMLQRRTRVQLPPELVHTRPFRELVRNFLIRAGKRHFVTPETSYFSIDNVYADIDRFVARSLPGYKGLRGVYAYEDGALHQFRKARQLGVHCIYDLPIGYWRANREIAIEEAELQPAWKGTLNALADSPAKLARKDEEIALADTIVVASSYTRSTLKLYPREIKKIVVIPYGTPRPIAASREVTSKEKPLRVLYVGSLAQRKGISYLFEAIDKLGSAVTLTVVGRKVGSSEALDKACNTHRWIPSLPHSEILSEMRQHDVFVFPSLFEGFGLVIGEALSQGLPVITTPNTGGPDILRDQQDGFIVPIRDPEAISARLLQLHQDRDLLHHMSESALQRAAELTWQGYKDRTVDAVRVAISGS
ncbi:glycosyltransferase family 4 protein [Acidicapsa ligni]|uniref:glycosyltransferase family 4 protein n=1 Tax=Acidicapsa ligni TaxID=542300 RepID=UPI0021E049E3|nr:glycosyltransferase family 4 protein [Acidicapsa ligni]